MMLYGSGWNCSPFWGTVLDIYKTLSCKSLIQKKKRKIPTYLPTSKMMGRSTANIHFFKDGPMHHFQAMQPSKCYQGVFTSVCFFMSCTRFLLEEFINRKK